jgi:biopolymer transport protein ExbD
MATRFHAAKQRRIERSARLAGETFNLVPLVDMLVSILFFSLLTYTGSTAFLLSFDLALPPVLRAEQEAPGPQDIELDLLLTVRVEEDALLVEYASAQTGNFSRRIEGLDEAALGQFQQVMQDIRGEYPQNQHVLVIPMDETSYDNVIHVLERLRVADFDMIALGQRRRATQVASAEGGR